jgi:ubiquinone/menaquinone biosynthesis C-methylase UbiE
VNHEEAGRLWNENAEVWTQLARSGYDLYRDHLNTPAFFELLPDVRGLSGLDVGCGEGHNTRLLAARGARVAAIDISDVFIRYAREEEAREPRDIDYRVASALGLPFGDSTFDFVVAFMSLMDMPDHDRALAEAYRVLTPGGFLQFSIEHPCFATPHRRNLRDPDRRTYAIEVGDYFRSLHGDVDEWIFKGAPPALRAGLRKFTVPRFTRTLSSWLNLVIETGFVIERLEEPRPSDETVRTCPALQDAQVVAYFLHVRARKPGHTSGELVPPRPRRAPR